MNARWQWRCLCRRLGRAAGGAAALEFGLLAPVLVLLLLGVLDFGVGFWDQLQVNTAAQAGAAYAVNSGFDSDAIEKAVASGGPAAIQAAPAPTQFCGCPNATSGITTAAPSTPPCSGTCASGGSPGTYVTVNAELGYTTIFPWPGVARPMTLSSAATVRIQ